MPVELVARVLLAVLVVGGLAFGDRIASIFASLDDRPELTAPEDLD